jgi:hypothetical protein
VAKIIKFPVKNKFNGKKSAAPRPSYDELRRALDAAIAVIEDTGHTLNVLEAELLHQKETIDKHSKYLLTLVRLLIREGYELPSDEV